MVAERTNGFPIFTIEYPIHVNIQYTFSSVLWPSIALSLRTLTILFSLSSLSRWYGMVLVGFSRMQYVALLRLRQYEKYVTTETSFHVIIKTGQ